MGLMFSLNLVTCSKFSQCRQPSLTTTPILRRTSPQRRRIWRRCQPPRPLPGGRDHPPCPGGDKSLVKCALFSHVIEHCISDPYINSLKWTIERRRCSVSKIKRSETTIDSIHCHCQYRRSIAIFSNIQISRHYSSASNASVSDLRIRNQSPRERGRSRLLESIVPID